MTQNLTIKGVGGPVYIEAPGTLSYGGNVSKGIFVTGTTGNTPNITIEGLTFSGAQNADENAAGIRYQSGNLTLIDDTFTNNQDGILATPFIENTGTIIEQGVTLNHNGTEDGVAHNEYIGLINTFIMENSVSEDAIVGHEVKSRAFNNVIENNLIKDTATGTASYSIDLPDGGNAIIQGNTIEKGPNAQTAVMIHYGGEEQYNPGTLTITDDTFINDYTNPDALVTAVSNQSLNTNVTVSDNTFENKTPATILSGPGTVTANISATGTVLASSSNTLPTTTAMTTSFAGLSAAETFTFTKVNYTVVGGTGHLTVTNALMNDNVVGGSGGVTFTGATGVVYTAAGSANLLTITGGVGIESYGNDTINLEKGLSHVNVYGTATVNDSSTGTTDFYVSGNMTLHEDSNYYDTFKILTGGTVTVDGTAENQQVQDQGGTFNFNTGTNVGSYTGYFLGGSDNAKTVSLTAWQNSLMTNSVTLTAGNYSIALGGGTVDAHAGFRRDHDDQLGSNHELYRWIGQHVDQHPERRRAHRDGNRRHDGNGPEDRARVHLRGRSGHQQWRDHDNQRLQVGGRPSGDGPGRDDQQRNHGGRLTAHHRQQSCAGYSLWRAQPVKQDFLPRNASGEGPDTHQSPTARSNGRLSAQRSS